MGKESPRAGRGFDLGNHHAVADRRLGRQDESATVELVVLRLALGGLCAVADGATRKQERKRERDDDGGAAQ